MHRLGASHAARGTSPTAFAGTSSPPRVALDRIIDDIRLRIASLAVNGLLRIFVHRKTAV
jgi:hypothetical protein